MAEQKKVFVDGFYFPRGAVRYQIAFVGDLNPAHHHEIGAIRFQDKDGKDLLTIGEPKLFEEGK